MTEDTFSLLVLYGFFWAADWIWLFVLVASGAITPSRYDNTAESRRRARRRFFFYFLLPFSWPWYGLKWSYRLAKHFLRNIGEIFRDPPPPEEYPRRK